MQALHLADTWLALPWVPAGRMALAVVAAAVSWRRDPQVLQALARVPVSVRALVWVLALAAGFLVLGLWLS